VGLANSFGIDIIITDHHQTKKDGMPEAFCIINPHQKACAYPFKYLAGIGLAYKLSQALMKKRYYSLEKHLDLVALGTVADVAPQKSENRIFTKHGVLRLNDTQNLGLKSLITVSGLGKKDISSSHIGYILGPRINAMGRIGSADIALKLLLTDNKVEADRLAGILNKENRNRQKIEAKILDEAISKVEMEVNFKEHRVIVLAKDGWHPGVIGIVASRIQERYYRPTILIALKEDAGKGSGRSIDKFHLFDALTNVKNHLLNFGGHNAACGLSIHKRNIDKFRDEINIYAKKNISDADLFPELDIDIDIPLADLNMNLINELDMLKPYGPENPRPVFSSSRVMLKGEPRYIGRNGFKMWVTSGGITCEAVSFRRGSIDIPRSGQIVDIVYSPGINSWGGIDSIQLDLRDIRIRS
jgi:single-stranded-DNA-specific exonuclease